MPPITYHYVHVIRHAEIREALDAAAEVALADSSAVAKASYEKTLNDEIRIDRIVALECDVAIRRSPNHQATLDVKRRDSRLVSIHINGSSSLPPVQDDPHRTHSYVRAETLRFRDLVLRHMGAAREMREDRAATREAARTSRLLRVVAETASLLGPPGNTTCATTRTPWSLSTVESWNDDVEHPEPELPGLDLHAILDSRPAIGFGSVSTRDRALLTLSPLSRYVSLPDDPVAILRFARKDAERRRHVGRFA